LSTSGKIRLLLALLFASLLFTATIVQSTYTPVNNLDQTAKILENNIHNKEDIAAALLSNNSSYNQLKKLPNNPTEALNFIRTYTSGKSIWLVTFNNDSLSFWSGIKIIPQNNSRIKEGVSFIEESNGYYEAIKKSEGSFSAILLFPIKINYPFQNQYLQNYFAKDLLQDNNIQIADFTDSNVYGIHSNINNAYLFSVKLTRNEVNHRFFYFEFIAWLLTFLTLCVLIHTVCKYFVGKGYVTISLLILGVFIVVVRYFTLHYNWPDFIYSLSIFNPSVYTAGKIYPSLGDFCLNILFISWFVAFLYTQRSSLLKITPGKFVSYLIVIVCTVVLILTSTLLLDLFYGLVSSSKISFDVYNVFNLSRFSFLGLVMLCFCFLVMFLLNEVFLFIVDKLIITDTQKIFIFLAGIFIATAVVTYLQGITLFYILLAIPVLLRGYAYKYKEGRIESTDFIIVVFVFALITFIKYQQVETVREANNRKTLIQKLETPDDVTADYIFKKIEKQIISDPLIVRYFNDTLHYNNLKNRFQKVYFDGYLSKYAYNIHEFNENGQPVSADKNYSLSVFKDLVLYSSFKVSDYFYRENDSFGFQNYFAILPITQNDKTLGTIVVELKSKPLEPAGSFPDLLKDGSIQQEDQFKDYSFAFYIDNKLVSKSGAYGYDLINTAFKGELKNYTTATTKSSYSEWYKSLITYSHLIYKPSERTLIVVSKEENSLFYNISSLTFFFILLLLFSLSIIVIRWLWLRIKILNINENSFKWIFKINFERILYKTRIQFSIVAAVVVTLIFVGFITFLSLSTQYNEQQENTIRDKISHITAAFENGLFDKYLGNINEESQVDFDELANTYSTDLVLYDQNGVPLITTQPKIYEAGLQFRRMNARAFIYLSKFKKSEFENEETIGELHYKAVYAPLINSKNVTVAYLQLPYFSNESDYNARIISLLNVMINVYALIFIVVGLFAVIIARQITAPLSFMQLNLSKIIYGKKNEPIKWERDDEIGSLVNEYNKMIAALENSAQKLAQSERESAWREMAKQVAHEIKNPLTPLKLGLQLLEKSWRDKDPKFDQKFERFSKSFVEQIESLSSIASEFSSFAKMPDTHIERMNVLDMLTQAVTIFVHMDGIKINYQQPEEPFYINADRDQILRCFNNLLKNAIEAKPPDQMGIIDISYLITNKNILLSLKDNGNGIPENMREKIFEPNFTTKSSGTGLGLAFVKNSIENAGGKVWFETMQGVGTTFYLSMPASDEAPKK
jgi:two-component system, NtrC family, nitrogen regulation sensor histidine kinase NtrY